MRKTYTETEKEIIRAMYLEGVTYKKIADATGVKKSTITGICRDLPRRNKVQEKSEATVEQECPECAEDEIKNLSGQQTAPKERKPSRIERIRMMDIAEIAEEIMKLMEGEYIAYCDSECDPDANAPTREDCKRCMIRWLQQSE